MLAFKCFQLQLSVHGKKKKKGEKKPRKTYNLHPYVLIHLFMKSPSCLLIAVTLFLQSLHKVTEMLLRWGRRLVNQTVFRVVSDLINSGAFYKWWLCKFRSTHRNQYWTKASQPETTKEKKNRISEMHEGDHVKKQKTKNIWILFFPSEKKVQDRRLNKCNFIFFVC